MIITITIVIPRFLLMEKLWKKRGERREERGLLCPSPKPFLENSILHTTDYLLINL